MGELPQQSPDGARAISEDPIQLPPNQRQREKAYGLERQPILHAIGHPRTVLPRGKGVQVPPEHLADGWAIDYQIPSSEKGEGLIPFRMASSKTLPKNTFAAVRYQDYWFYIDKKDIESKRSLGLIIALFRVLAPSGGGAAPILTLPTG